jgi:hypothetical protein
MAAPDMHQLLQTTWNRSGRTLLLTLSCTKHATH